jgi:hypothetical protein
MGALLLLGAATVIVTNAEQVREINLFACVLTVQSLPFLAATILAVLEETRFNDFAFWKDAEARLAELLPRRAVVSQIGQMSPISQMTPISQPAPQVENRIEAAP